MLTVVSTNINRVECRVGSIASQNPVGVGTNINRVECRGIFKKFYK